MTGWILPALAYVVLLGAGGVTAKLALRTITWQQLVLWVPIAGAWAAATAVCASAALVLFFYALTKGPVSQVTPATSAYPVVTVIGSAIFLAEKITLVRGIGTALVVFGVVLLAR